MRRKKQEITDKEIIKEILSKSIICRLGLIDGGRSYIVPVNYGYSDNTIYIHSASEGKKIELLKLNNNVCFEIEYHSEIIKKEKACDWNTKYRSVIGYGSIEIITDEEEKKQGLDFIMKQHGSKDNNVYKNSSLKNMVILKLNIEEITGKQSGEW
jgi:nitroimidazol reductase NimA-like FMN-containing flavoprotein (pyridoxamine 5'-phosphate oxidase superfamily)